MRKNRRTVRQIQRKYRNRKRDGGRKESGLCKERLAKQLAKEKRLGVFTA